MSAYRQVEFSAVHLMVHVQQAAGQNPYYAQLEAQGEGQWWSFMKKDRLYGVFPKIAIPQNGWFLMENPII